MDMSSDQVERSSLALVATTIRETTSGFQAAPDGKQRSEHIKESAREEDR